MRGILLLAVVGLMVAVRSFEAAGTELGSGSALSVGFLLLTAYFAGSVAKSIRLPRLTGYLAAGLAAGASGLQLLPSAVLDDLRIFTGVAVALIALTAGTELELRSMRSLARTIGWVTFIAVVGGALLLGCAVMLLRPLLPFMDGMSTLEAMAVAGVLGVVMSAQSPAVVVALRTELAADGPVCRTVLGVVVIADLVVILMFALSSTIATSVFGETTSVRATIIHLAWELLGSIVAGLGIGVILAAYLKRVGHGAAMFVIMVAFIVAEVGQRIGLDPLLVALAAGVLIRNTTKQGDALHHAIEGSALPVYLVFFAQAGATIHLDVLMVVGVPAIAMVLVRTGSFLGGARIATRIAGAPESVRRWVGFGLLPQAGLALALSMLFSRTFPEFGADAGAMTLGVVALNELVAPVLYRFALVRSGEAGRMPQQATGQHEAVTMAIASDSSSSGAIVVGAEISTSGAIAMGEATGGHPTQTIDDVSPPARSGGTWPGVPG